MFSSFLGRALAVPALCCAMAIVGCKSMHHDHMSSSDASKPGDMMKGPMRTVVATNHGQTTYFTLNDSGQMTEMSSDGAMVCSDCRMAAKGYFAGGKLPETCPACGAKLMASNTTTPPTRKG